MDFALASVVLASRHHLSCVGGLNFGLGLPSAVCIPSPIIRVNLVNDVSLNFQSAGHRLTKEMAMTEACTHQPLGRTADALVS